jgi:hypothetical protein
MGVGHPPCTIAQMTILTGKNAHPSPQSGLLWTIPSNAIWSYTAPFPAVEKIAGGVTFDNELVDTTLESPLGSGTTDSQVTNGQEASLPRVNGFACPVPFRVLDRCRAMWRQECARAMSRSARAAIDAHG